MQMDEIKVKKTDLLTTLKNNREKHVSEYKQAVEGYRKKLIEELTTLLEDVKLGKDVSLRDVLALPKPNNHEDDYSRVIQMLEMAVEDTVELREDQFRKYVQDDWTWKNEHLAMSASYGR